MPKNGHLILPKNKHYCVPLTPDPTQRSRCAILKGPLFPCQIVSEFLTSTKYKERLAEAGIEPSVGSVGGSYDNALAETIIGLYKTEVIRLRGP